MEQNQTRDFSNIWIDRKSTKILKKSLKDHVIITDKNYPSIKRLQVLGLVEIKTYDTGVYCGKKFCVATYIGDSYYSYRQHEKAKDTKEFWRYLITTLIAIMALLISAITLLLEATEC